MVTRVNTDTPTDTPVHINIAASSSMTSHILATLVGSKIRLLRGCSDDILVHQVNPFIRLRTSVVYLRKDVYFNMHTSYDDKSGIVFDGICLCVCLRKISKTAGSNRYNLIEIGTTVNARSD